MQALSLRKGYSSFESSPPTRSNPHDISEHFTSRDKIRKQTTISSAYHKRATSEIDNPLPGQDTRTSTASTGRRPCYLNTSIWYREIYIIQDGIINKQDILNGFKFKFSSFGDVKRQNQQKELSILFEACAQRWNSRKKFIGLFTIDGKLLKSLNEIDPHTKLAVVSQDLQFVGFGKAEITHKQVLEIIEEAFVIKDHGLFVTSPRKKGVLLPDTSADRSKSLLMKFRDKSATNKTIKTKPKLPRFIRNKFTHLEYLKNKLGETSSKIDKSLPNLQHKTVKFLMNKYELSESIIYKIYAQFKTLQLLSVAQHPLHNIKLGVNNDTMIQYLRKGDGKVDGILETLIKTIDVDGKGYLRWEEFLRAMSVINFGSVSQQIDMIYKMYDFDCNGSLEYNEIKELCKRQLGSSGKAAITEYLSESFATILFQMAAVSITHAISAEQIKSLLQGKEEKAIVQMLCNFNL